MARVGRKPTGPGDSKGSREFFKWIQDRGLTQTKAGELLGYSKETISRYVTGERLPVAEAMYKIEKLADIPMAHWHES
tara:strand:- start:179 stop:412 length:234 start_codon:yes stop_codon:yes gene_type:complete